MVYTFVINIVHLNLNPKTTKYRCLANKNTTFWKLSLVIINFCLIKTCIHSWCLGIRGGNRGGYRPRLAEKAMGLGMVLVQ